MIELTDDNFTSFVQNSKLPVIVDFWAPWCGPCKVMIPILEKFLQNNKNVNVAKCNIDENPNITNHLNIISIPTLLFFKNDKIVNKAVGIIPESKLIEYCNLYFK